MFPCVFIIFPLFVLIHNRTKGEVGTVFKPSRDFYLLMILLLWIPFVLYVSVCLFYTVLSVPCSLVITYWERADLFALLCVTFLCVFVTFSYLSWSTFELRVRLVSLNIFLLTDVTSFVDPFCYLCFTFVFIILSCLFLVALWSPAGKELPCWHSCVWCFLVFLSLSHMGRRFGYGIWLYIFLIFAFFSTFVRSIFQKWMHIA